MSEHDVEQLYLITCPDHTYRHVDQKALAHVTTSFTFVLLPAFSPMLLEVVTILIFK